MRVLDVDMDFFLTDVCELAEAGERPSRVQALPWSEGRVRAFLEGRCGLSRERRVPGAVFETHEAALFFWRDRIREGRLFAPFIVDHVDAHSDLGIGRPGPAYVLETVLSMPPANRLDLERYRSEQRLDEANYLLFALALRWVCELNDVRNPHSRADVPERIGPSFAAGDCHSLRLTSSISRLIPRLDFHEPEIPFRLVGDFHTFHAGGQYAFATMAVSPRYAPREADFIADVFREYITQAR